MLPLPVQNSFSKILILILEALRICLSPTVGVLVSKPFSSSVSQKGLRPTLQGAHP